MVTALLVALAMLSVDPTIEIAIEMKTAQFAAKHESEEMSNEGRREAIRGDVLKWLDRPATDAEDACIKKHVRKYDRLPARQDKIKAALPPPETKWQRVIIEGRVWRVWGIQNPETKMIDIKEDAEHPSQLEN